VSHGRRSAGWLALSILLLAAAPAVAGSDDAGLERLRTFLDELDTLTADFSQEVVNRDLELVESATGRVVLQKPGRFRWDYQQPFERVIVADGERVWLYEADLDQVTVRRLDAGLGETPAALLTGTADVLERFEFLGSDTEGDLLWIRLGPLSADADFDDIRLAFAGDVLHRLELRDRLGQTTRLAFSGVDREAGLAPDTFRFVPPAGVDVIGEDEL
jgi:outer membrane lipoprotein carrier protein